MSDTSIPLRAGRPTIAVRDTKQQVLEWAPLSDPNRLSFTGTSYKTVRDALFAVFGKFPIRLSKEHESVLRAMGAVAKESTGGETPYNQLVEALRKFGDLEIRDL